jgi:hypothetical protein
MFEDHYRGSTDLIKDRISFYLPFILPLKEKYPQNFAVDLGYGRGLEKTYEWIDQQDQERWQRPRDNRLWV